MVLTAVMAAPGLRSLLLGALCASVLFIAPAQAHMELELPPPWDDPESANAADRNYNIKSPLHSDGSDFPCQGLNHASDSPKKTTTYQAGETYNTTIEGYAAHDGGSCQLSLSYDDGKTWKVIKSIIGGCPSQGSASYEFTIPAAAPAGPALFAWTWINHTGNREFYMNCAVVDIEGQSGGDLCMLPNLYVANLAGINSCTTPEGVDPMYPNPGEDVVYANGMSSSSPIDGDSSCEIAAPDCGGSGGDYTLQTSSKSSTPSASAGTITSYAYVNATTTASRSRTGVITDGVRFTSMVEAYIASVLGASAAAATGAEGAALTSMVESYINSVLHRSSPTHAPASHTPTTTMVMTTFSTTRTTSSTTTLTLIRNATSPTSDTTSPTHDNAAIKSFIQSLLSSSAAPSTALPSAHNIFNEAAVHGPAHCSTTACPPRPTATQTITAPPPATTCTGPIVACSCLPGYTCAPLDACTTSCVPVSSTLRTLASSSPSPPSASASGSPSYIPTSPNAQTALLPCTPGALLCADPNSFYTCNQSPPPELNATTTDSWAWQEPPRAVAQGMMCLPAVGPSGQREDRYVKARGEGVCGTDGEVGCTDGGWRVCVGGGWVNMGGVQEGMGCVEGVGLVRVG